MSLKTIELQVALPRTVDAGKMAEQLQQRGQLSNDQAAYEMEKKSKKESQTVQSGSIVPESGLKKDPQTKNERELPQKAGNGSSGKAAESHPYKGKTIDYNG
ncbi:MAG TPA: hypothetical protein VIG80_11030 [Bacillaceae bacterium]